jgi:basic membrane lipoprotein Med (substrate-binding protein (PBP1-ABC) superfamily)
MNFLKHRTIGLLVLIMILGLGVLVYGTEAKADDVDLVVILYGHANEGTWDPALIDSLTKVEKNVSFNLHLNETTKMHDLEKALRSWAGKGADLIYAHSGGYLETTVKVSKHFKKSHFMGILNSNPKEHKEYEKYLPKNTPSNLLLLGHTPYEGNYLAGFAAGLSTKSGIIGILQPFESQEINRYANSFFYGAKAANPSVKVKPVIIGNYVAPTETRDAVKSLAQQGCDVVIAILDDNSAILESAEHGIYCISTYKDRHSVDPKTVLTSVVYDWSKPFEGAIKAIEEDNFAQYRKKHYFRGLSIKDGSLSLGPWGSNVPDSVKNAVEKEKDRIINGEIKMKISDKSISSQQ